jgi:hypothetical protein
VDAPVASAIAGAGHGAHAQHRNAVAIGAGLRRGAGIGLPRLRRQQQDVAAGVAGLLEQVARQCDAAIRAPAVHRHHVGRQRVEEDGDVVGIGRDRRHHEGIVGIHHQSGLPGMRVQERVDARARLHQARRLQVVGQRGTGKIEHDHQRAAPCLKRLRNAAPTRTGQRDDRHGQAREHGCACKRCAAPTTARIEQVRQQVRIHGLAPAAALPCPLAPGPGQQRQRQQGHQPGRTQEVQIGQRAHRRAFREARPAANRPQASASARGQ